MQVKEIMSRSVRSVTPDTKIMEVAEKDVLHSLFPTVERLMEEGMANVDLDNEMGKYKDVLARPVSELMTTNPLTVNSDMHILRAATVMVRNRFRRIPVADDGRLVGMLSLGDVHKAIFHANVADKLKTG